MNLKDYQNGFYLGFSSLIKESEYEEYPQQEQGPMGKKIGLMGGGALTGAAITGALAHKGTRGRMALLGAIGGGTMGHLADKI